MKWLRIDDRKLRNTGGDPAIVKRVYGADGKLWPRLVLSIYPSSSGPIEVGDISVIILASVKRKSGWWYECGVPVSLFSELHEMIIFMWMKILVVDFADLMEGGDGTGPPGGAGGLKTGQGGGFGRAPGKGSGAKSGGKKGGC